MLASKARYAGTYAGRRTLGKSGMCDIHHSAVVAEGAGSEKGVRKERGPFCRIVRSLLASPDTRNEDIFDIIRPTRAELTSSTSRRTGDKG